MKTKSFLILLSTISLVSAGIFSREPSLETKPSSLNNPAGFWDDVEDVTQVSREEVPRSSKRFKIEDDDDVIEEKKKPHSSWWLSRLLPSVKSGSGFANAGNTCYIGKIQMGYLRIPIVQHPR